MTDTIQESLRMWVRGEWVAMTDQELVTEAADEIDRLLADVKFWNETAIEYKRQLNETIRRGPESAGLHIITEDQINAAWEKLHLRDAWSRRQIPPGTGKALDVFRDLGIVSCDECGGCATPGCVCNGNGWVMEER